MELEGQKIEATLNSGSADTVLDPGVSKLLFGFDEKTPNIETETSPSGATFYRFMDLTNEGLTVMNAKVRLSNTHGTGSDCFATKIHGVSRAAGFNRCYNVFPLNLGQNVMQKLHLYFAMKEKMLYFTAADATWNSPTNLDSKPAE